MTDTPQAPATLAEAATRLAALEADPAMVKRVLAGDGPAVREFQALIAKKSEATGDHLDQIIAGTAEAPMFETLTDGRVSVRNQMTAVAALKESGISEQAIRDLLENKPLPKDLYDTAMRFEADLTGSKDWVAKVLAGDHEAVRQLKLLSMIKVQGFFREEKAP